MTTEQVNIVLMTADLRLEGDIPKFHTPVGLGITSDQDRDTKAVQMVFNLFGCVMSPACRTAFVNRVVEAAREIEADK